MAARLLATAIHGFAGTKQLRRWTNTATCWCGVTKAARNVAKAAVSALGIGATAAQARYHG
jgi:hypothetical protein